jgi:uncharacterized protein YukE
VTVETRLEGEPTAISDAAQWLRGRFAGEASNAGDAVLEQRSRLASDWQGAAGEAFNGRAATLGHAADGVAGIAREGGATLATLATALRTAKDALADVRHEAAGAGLTVSGTVIQEPAPVPLPSLVPLDQLDGAGRAAQQQAADLFAEYQEKVRAYRKAARDAREIFDDWDRALSRAISDWSMDDTKLALKIGSLMVSAAGAGVKLRLSPRLAQQAAEHMDLARSARRTAYDMLDGKAPFSKQAYDDLINWGRHAQNSADDLLASSRSPELPKGVKAAGHGMGLLGAGYGAYYDINHGESPEQAVASNGGGLLAGTAAGAAVGGAVGSVVPVGGTLVGAGVGAVVGTGVGVVTSGAIDSAFENGVDSVGDAGDALADGVSDLGDMVGL